MFRGVAQMELGSERELLAAASRGVAASGYVVGTAGNLSLRVDDRVVVTPTGGNLGELTAEMMTVVDMDGRVVDGELAPTSELPLHLSVYQATGAGAVAHAHALASTAVSCSCDELPAIHYTILELGGAIRVAPYATFGSAELAANVTAALEGRVAALMQSHGSVAYGNDITQACSRLTMVEWHAELYARSLAFGKPRVMTDAELEGVIMAAINMKYGLRKAADGADGADGADSADGAGA